MTVKILAEIQVGNEFIKMIWSGDSMKKQYVKKFVFLMAIIFTTGVALAFFHNDGHLGVGHNVIGIIGIGLAFFSIIFGSFGAISPSRLRMGNKHYEKMVVIEKDEFDKLKKLGIQE